VAGTLLIEQPDVLADEPVQFSVVGCSPGEAVTITAAWIIGDEPVRSEARFTADSTGIVTPDRHASIGGSEDVPAIMQIPGELRALARVTDAKRHEFVRRCWQKGVRITTGTDGAGLGRLLPGFGVHHEIGLLRDAGLSPCASLRAASISAARALNLADQIGSAAAGKAADFRVWTANPLTTHLRPTDLALVVLGGAVHQRSALTAAAGLG